MIIIPRLCLTCNHEDREEIEAALRFGDIPRVVAEAFPDLNENAIRRHSAHMDKDGMAIVVRGGQTVLASAVKGVGLLDELSNLYAEAAAVGTHAMVRGNENVGLKALQTKLSIIDAVRKINETDKAAESSEVNASAANDLRMLVGALKEVLPKYPEAGAALATELEEMSEWQAAASIRNLMR